MTRFDEARASGVAHAVASVVTEEYCPALSMEKRAEMYALLADSIEAAIFAYCEQAAKQWRSAPQPSIN